MTASPRPPSAVTIDASIALKLVLTEPYTAEARTLIRDWTVAGVRCLSPTLYAYEVTNGLLRKRASGASGIVWIALSVADLLAIVPLVPPDLILIERATAMADELGRPAAYDAHYAALAEREGCERWTADERFWNAAKPRYPWVRWVGEVTAQQRSVR